MVSLIILIFLFVWGGFNTLTKPSFVKKRVTSCHTAFGGSCSKDSEVDEGKGGTGGGGDHLDPGLGLGSEDEDFPPRWLLGPAFDSTAQPTFASASASSVRRQDGGNWGMNRDVYEEIHPVVARRGREFLHFLCKTSLRVRYDMLTTGPAGEGDDSVAEEEMVSSRDPSSGKSKGKGESSQRGKGMMTVEDLTHAGK